MKIRALQILALAFLMTAGALAGEKPVTSNPNVPADAAEKNFFQQVYLEVDVAMNGLSMRESDLGSFIIQGYIYPKGTLTPGFQSNGVLPDGSPEFPELVIGRWLCKGWGLPQDPNRTVIVTSTTTQTFEMDMEYPGNDAIHSEGFEYGEPVTVSPRVVIGGTGRYSWVRGQQMQSIIGLNATQGANLTVAFVRQLGIHFKDGESGPEFQDGEED